MIDQLKPMAVFVTVVEEKSFRGAAKKLGLAVSVVSHHISNLEKQLGAPLLYRSTRILSLTDEGRELFTASKNMLKHANIGLSTFSQTSTQAVIPLRLAIPSVLTTHPLFSRISAFAQESPGVMLSIISSDITQNLLQESFDLAIRMGKLQDSELKARQVSKDRLVTVASPSLVAKMPPLKSPNDLKDWDFINFSPVPELLSFQKTAQKPIKIWGNTRIITDSVFAMRELVLSGIGAAGLPFEAIKNDLKSKQLIELFPDYSNGELDIILVWPRNADLNPTTRALINFLAK